MNRNSNSINRSKIDGIEVRPARVEDLKQIDNLLTQNNFDTGFHILELYYLHSNKRWLVAVDEKTGQIVAFDSAHILPVNDVAFGFEMLVKKEYQNRGLIRAIAIVYEPAPFMGNATPEAALLFPQMEKYDMKLVGYVGKPNWGPANFGYVSDEFQNFAPVEISILENQEDMGQVLVYDRSVLDLDRAKFMRAWCAKSESGKPYAKTLVARRKSDGVVVGFGTLRLYSDYYVISPLYADDQVVAKRLLIEVVKILEQDCGEQSLYMLFDAKNFLMMEFVHRLKFERCDCEMRNYAKGAIVIKDRIKFERVYALQDYWPA